MAKKHSFDSHVDRRGLFVRLVVIGQHGCLVKSFTRLILVLNGKHCCVLCIHQGSALLKLLQQSSLTGAL